MQDKKQQLQLDMEQWTGSKLRKEYVKAVYGHPPYLNSIQSTSYEMLGWMNHKLESRLPREILTLDTQMCVLVPQSCLTATPWTVASVLGILPARILGWVAISFFRGSS